MQTHAGQDSCGFKGAAAPIDLTNFFINVKSNHRMHQNQPVSGKNSIFFWGGAQLPPKTPHPRPPAPIIKFWIHHWAKSPESAHKNWSWSLQYFMIYRVNGKVVTYAYRGTYVYVRTELPVTISSGLAYRRAARIITFYLLIVLWVLSCVPDPRRWDAIATNCDWLIDWLVAILHQRPLTIIAILRIKYVDAIG